MKTPSARHTSINKISRWSGLAILSTSLLISACSSDSDDDEPDLVQGEGVAIVATVAADYTSGAHASIQTGTPITVTENLAPTISDITVAAHGDYFYRIERFNSDNVTKFSFDAPATPIWQFSTLDAGEEGSGNPQGMIFLNDNKAYIPRYGKNTLWIVNPSATSQEEFKIGEIDLSAYDSNGDIVEMSPAAIVGDKLFIAMQRLDPGYVPGDAYVAVIDTNTDTEINTGNNADFMGILLPLKNPTSIEADETGMLYVQSPGKYGFGGEPNEYSGGIATIDPDTFETALLVDDGDADNHPFGQITGVEIVSSGKGYLIAQHGFGDSALHAFNPLTGVVDEQALSGLSGVNISGLAADSNERLWVGTGASDTDSAAIRLIDSTSDSLIDAPIELSLNPITIVFDSTLAP
ncbi:MAG: hypothetical protein KDJ38_08775 [Gammaproteobacteria bacterium]|nr:hypothetical protein [Gammaproteobacteria bacterium]